MQLIKRVKYIFLTIEELIWDIKCRYKFWLLGPYGLSKVIENMPLHFMIKYFRKYGAEIGENCIIDSGIKIHRPGNKIPFENLVIGSNIYLGHNLLIDLTDKIVIENNTALGANCQIWTHVGDYKYFLRDKEDYKEIIGPVIFKEGFCGYSGIIFNPGAILGQYARVLALSMVSGTIPDKEIWGGIPAKFIKKRLFD
ncbi:hypothetical protein ES705_21392 [subsurface metagenome]